MDSPNQDNTPLRSKRLGLFWSFVIAAAVYAIFAVILKWGIFNVSTANTISGPIIAGQFPFGELLRYSFGNTDNVSPFLSLAIALPASSGASESTLFLISVILGLGIYLVAVWGLFEFTYRFIGAGSAAMAVLLFAASSKFLTAVTQLDPSSLGACLFIWGSVLLYNDVKRRRISWFTIVVFSLTAWCGPGFAVAALAGLLAAFYGAKGWMKLLIVPLFGILYTLVRLLTGGWEAVWAVPTPVFNLAYLSIGERLGFLWFNYVHNAMILFQGFYISFFLIGALFLVIPLVFYANSLLKVGLPVDRFSLYYVLAAPAFGLLGWIFNLDSGNGFYPGGASFYPLVAALLAAGIAGFSQRRFLGFAAGGRIAGVITVIAFVGMGALGYYELYLKIRNELDLVTGVDELLEKSDASSFVKPGLIIAPNYYPARKLKTVPPGFGWGSDNYRKFEGLGFAPLLSAASKNDEVYVILSKARAERYPGVFDSVCEGRPFNLYRAGKTSGDYPPRIIKLTNSAWILNICDIVSEGESDYKMIAAGRGPFFERPYLTGVYASILDEAANLAYDPYDGALTAGRSTAIYEKASEEFTVRLENNDLPGTAMSLIWTVRSDDELKTNVTWNGTSVGDYVCEPGNVTLVEITIQPELIAVENLVIIESVEGYETVDYTSYSYRLIGR